MERQQEGLTVGTQTLGLPPEFKNIPSWTPPNTSNWRAPQLTGNQLADVSEASLQSAQSMCIGRNNDLIFKYYGAMNGFYISANAGKKSRSMGNWDPPNVPHGYGVIGPDDSTQEFFAMEGIGAPVCNPIPLPEDMVTPDTVPEGTIDIGTAMQAGTREGYFHVGKNNRVPIGIIVVGRLSADNVRGDFQLVGSPSGGQHGSWWLKVGG